MKIQKFMWALTVSGCALALTACGAAPPTVTEAISGEITLLAGTAESNEAPAGTGDFAVPNGGPTPQDEQIRQVSQRWVGLEVGSVTGLDEVVTNSVGLTLYRFDRDSADPPTSNCDGECAETWPKVLVGENSRLFIDRGIDQSDVGSIPSGDGTFQLTIGGWPVYRFAKDTRAGQVNGQGVGDTWFAIGPDGQKADGGRADDGRGGSDNNDDDNKSDDNNNKNDNDNDGGGNDDNTATRITLFDEPGRSGSDAAQAVSNSQADATGCVDIPRAEKASSVSARGSYTLWRGADCTGDSLRLNGNVDDLGDEGFDDAAESVSLALGR